jgi:hypothetical protein
MAVLANNAFIKTAHRTGRNLPAPVIPNSTAHFDALHCKRYFKPEIDTRHAAGGIRARRSSRRVTGRFAVSVMEEQHEAARFPGAAITTER